MVYSFEVNCRSQKVGIFGLSEDRTQRLELMLLLQEKYKMNSVQISDFLNSNNIKTPRNKIVWGSIMKYKKRLDRYNLDTIDRVKETISYSIDS